MTIYFDAQRHVICAPYSVDRLHQMAKVLGIKRCWYHAQPYPHYDLPKRFTWTQAIVDTLVDQHAEVICTTPRELLTIIKQANI
jgi:hypothetical protein